MTQKHVLVTGATGKTGAYTVPLLIQRGCKVRAFVHTKDERSARLRAMGAEIVVGDLLDLQVVSEALKTIDSAYFCYPIELGLVEATGYFAQGARDAGVKAIVNMSQISARREAKSNAARQHWISERIFDWSGVPVTHLRPTFFAEWLLLAAKMIVAEGVIAFPFGNGRHAPIAAEDQAHAIAAILEKPEPHAGHTYPLYGPVEMNYEQIATQVTQVLGRPVLYQPIEIEEFAERIVLMRGESAHLVQHLSNVAIDYRNGLFAGTNDVIRQVGGAAPMTVARFVEKHKPAFQAGNKA